jgi:hypothetical protein
VVEETTIKPLSQGEAPKARPVIGCTEVVVPVSENANEYYLEFFGRL